MMGHKRDKRGKQDIGETYANYWIRQHQAEMCRYQPIVRENSMVTLRTNQILPERAFVREGSLINLKSSPRKNNEFNFARDLTLSREPTFIRDHTIKREHSFPRDQSSYYDKYASCNHSQMMDANSVAGDRLVRETSDHTGTGFLPDQSQRLFEKWDSYQKVAIPQRKYSILPQIGNPRFVSVQDTRHQFVNQLDYSRDTFEKDADFFADYNKRVYHEEVRNRRGVPLPPVNSLIPRFKLNFMHQTEDDISEETSRCFTNSVTLSDNLATSSLDQYSDDNYTITSGNTDENDMEVVKPSINLITHNTSDFNSKTETIKDNQSGLRERGNTNSKTETMEGDCSDRRASGDTVRITETMKDNHSGVRKRGDGISETETMEGDYSDVRESGDSVTVSMTGTMEDYSDDTRSETEDQSDEYTDSETRSN